MVDAGGEVDLRGLERVVGREVDGEEEDTARVWRITLLVVSVWSRCKSPRGRTAVWRSAQDTCQAVTSVSREVGGKRLYSRVP